MGGRVIVSLLIPLLILSGCMSFVRTTTTNFHAPGHEARGSIFVVAADANVNSSLEFQSYKTKIEVKLITTGYTIAQSVEEANFIAMVSYGIDNGKTSIVSTPIFGQTGGGTTYSSGTVYGAGSSASYSGSSYTMPSYGVVGSSTSSVTQYTRAVAIDIVEAQGLKDGIINKKYEIRAKSTGSCSVIAEVFDEILEAMFKEFPGNNGGSKTIDIPGKFNC